MTPRRDSVAPASHRAAPASLLARLRGPRGGAGPAPATIGDQDAWVADRAARALATACARARRGVPAVLAVVVGAETVSLLLAAPDDRPPEGWTAEPHGRTWHAAPRWLRGAPVDESSPAPYPRLVSLGATDDGFVLLNLGRAGGVVSVEGDATQAGLLLDEWTRELEAGPWAPGVQVVRVGFHAGTAGTTGTAGTAGGGWRMEADRLDDAEPALAAPGGGVLLFADRPTEREEDRLSELADDPAGRWSVVVAGPVEDARWRLSVDPEGVVDTGILDGPTATADAPATGPDGAVRPAAPGAAVGAGGPWTETGAPPAAAPERPAAPRRRLMLLGVVVLCLAVVAIPIAARTLAGRAGGHPAAGRSPTGTPTSPSPSATPSPSASPSATPSPSPSSSRSPSSRPPTSRPASTPPTVPPGGTGTIRSVAAGLCVDSDSNPAMALNGTPSGGHAFTSACNGTKSQQWSEGPLLSKDSPRGDDMYRLVDRATGYCLDSNQDGIYTLPCLDPDGYQVWQRVRIDATTVGYRNQATNRCLSVAKVDSALKTQPCPTGGWPVDLQFNRLP